MTKNELIEVIKYYKLDMEDIETVLSAVNAYTAALLQQSNVSGSMPPKTVDIDFAGNVLARIETRGDLKILAAIDGYSNKIQMENIIVSLVDTEEKL